MRLEMNFDYLDGVNAHKSISTNVETAVYATLRLMRKKLKADQNLAKSMGKISVDFTGSGQSTNISTHVVAMVPTAKSVATAKVVESAALYTPGQDFPAEDFAEQILDRVAMTIGHSRVRESQPVAA